MFWRCKVQTELQADKTAMPVNMEVKKMSCKLIKPLTPTPPNLKNYKISFPDRKQLPNNIALILFYRSRPETNQQLEESLAKTLVLFYPLAGRYIKQQNSIDCNDHGAEFTEAESPTDLRSEIAADHHNHLLPDNFFHTDESAARPLLSIQSTRFSCGGAAIAIVVSHRIADVSSVDTFIAAWANTAAGQTVTPPSFDLPSLLPCDGRDFPERENPFDTEDIIVKKVVFDGATLASLRSKIGKPAASAARLASAVIAEALIRIHRANFTSRGFCICQPVNMRGRTNTPLKDHTFGNFAFMAVSQLVDADARVGVSELVVLIGEAVRRCTTDHGELVCGKRDGWDIIMDGIRKSHEALEDSSLILFTDRSKFEFYEADFGWGKPVSTRGAAKLVMDCATLIMRDEEGDGIQAWLHLKKSKMSYFEQHGELIINQIIHDLN